MSEKADLFEDGEDTLTLLGQRIDNGKFVDGFFLTSDEVLGFEFFEAIG